MQFEIYLRDLTEEAQERYTKATSSATELIFDDCPISVIEIETENERQQEEADTDSYGKEDKRVVFRRLGFNNFAIFLDEVTEEKDIVECVVQGTQAYKGYSESVCSLGKMKEESSPLSEEEQQLFLEELESWPCFNFNKLIVLDEIP